MAGAREFAEIWGEEMHRASQYRAVVLLLALGLTASGAGHCAAALQPEPPPLVVRVDEVGRAEVVDYLPEAVAPTSPETLFFIRRFVVDQYERRAAVVEERWGRSFHFVSQSVADALVVEHSDEVTGYLSGRLRDEVRVEDVAIRVIPGVEPPYGAEVRFDRVTYVSGRETARGSVTLGLQFSFTAVDRALVFDNPIGLVISFLEVSEVVR